MVAKRSNLNQSKKVFFSLCIWLRLLRFATNDAFFVIDVQSNTVTLSTTQATVITSQPQSGTIITQDGTHTFNVIAEGNSLTYEWYKAENEQIGENTDTYTTDEAGTYYVVVNGTCGSVTSAEAILTVAIPTVEHAGNGSHDFGIINDNNPVQQNINIIAANLHSELVVTIEDDSSNAFSLHADCTTILKEAAESGTDIKVIFNTGQLNSSGEYTGKLVISGGGLTSPVEIDLNATLSIITSMENAPGKQIKIISTQHAIVITGAVSSTVTITDITAKILYTGNVKNNINTFEVPGGMYLVTINDKTTKVFVK